MKRIFIFLGDLFVEQPSTSVVIDILCCVLHKDCNNHLCVYISSARNCMRLQVLELDHVSEINQEVAAEMCREGLKGLEMLVLTSTPVTPKALLHFNSESTLDSDSLLLLSILVNNSSICAWLHLNQVSTKWKPDVKRRAIKSCFIKINYYNFYNQHLKCPYY